MLSITELPRKGGIIQGRFRARHRSDSFGLRGYGFTFRNGDTVEPIKHLACTRLAAAYGSAISFFPCDEASAELALSWMAERNMPEKRIAEVRDLLRMPSASDDEERDVDDDDTEQDDSQEQDSEGGEADDGEDDGEDDGPPPSEPGPASETASTEPPEDAAAETEAAQKQPTTATELAALSDDAVRQLAADLGVTDKRWSAKRMRTFIAQELGL